MFLRADATYRPSGAPELASLHHGEAYLRTVVGRHSPALRAPHDARRLPFGDWWRHPTPFRAGTLQRAIEAAAVPPGGLVVDCFNGGSSTGAYVVGRGDRFAGIDAHPLFAELGAVKLKRLERPDGLLEAGEEVVSRARRLPPVGDPHPDLQRTIAPLLLDELYRIREVIDHCEFVEERAHLRFALLDALRQVAGASWPRPRSRPPATVLAPFTAALGRMANDLRQAPRRVDGSVVRADTRSDSAWRHIRPQTVDACITSPPYPNQVSYLETTRLELYFLGLVRDWAGLRDLRRQMVASCTQEVDSDRALLARGQLEAFPEAYGVIGEIANQLELARRSRRRGKPYSDLVWTYFGDVTACLRQVAKALKPGGRLVWVIGESAPYGVLLDTPSLTNSIATGLGFEPVEDLVLGTRGTQWPDLRSRHACTLHERLLVLRSSAQAEQLTLSATAEISTGGIDV
jgi:hypothetical protein